MNEVMKQRCRRGEARNGHGENGVVALSFVEQDEEVQIVEESRAEKGMEMEEEQEEDEMDAEFRSAVRSSRYALRQELNDEVYE